MTITYAWRVTGTEEGIKYTMLKRQIIKTHHYCVVIKIYSCHTWVVGIKHNGNFTSAIFPIQQELSPIYGQFIGHLEQGVPMTTKLNLHFKKKLLCNCHGHNF